MEATIRRAMSPFVPDWLKPKLVSYAIRSGLLRRSQSGGAFLPLARDHLADISAGVKLLDGWLPMEYQGPDLWRWMGEEATIELPATSSQASFLLLGFRSLDELPVNTLTVSGPNGSTVHPIHFGYNVAVIKRSDICSRGKSTAHLKVGHPHLAGRALMVSEIATTDAIAKNGRKTKNLFRIGVGMKSRSDLARLVGLSHHMAAHSTEALMHLFNLVHYEFPTPPRNPNSPEYRDFWMNEYKALHGADYSLDNESHDFGEEQMVNVFPYCTDNAKVIGDQLIAVGSLIRSMNLSAGARVLEMGVGWGNTALQLGLSGYDCTVLDIEPKYLEIVKRRFEKEGLKVNSIQGDFFEIEKVEERFDAIVFFECFHHCDDHSRLLDVAISKLAEGGKLVFAGEPISKLFPYAWGLNPTGQGIWTIAHHGWLELCFREDYFIQMLRSRGLHISTYPCPQTAAGRVYIAEKQLQ